MIKKKYSHHTIRDEQIQKLYLAAKAVAVPQVISEQMCSGGVGAAVCTKQGRIFTGVCVDTDCSLGMCAERNALSTMITAGEFDIDMVIAVNKTEKCCRLAALAANLWGNSVMQTIYKWWWITTAPLCTSEI